MCIRDSTGKAYDGETVGAVICYLKFNNAVVGADYAFYVAAGGAWLLYYCLLYTSRCV